MVKTTFTWKQGYSSVHKTIFCDSPIYQLPMGENYPTEQVSCAHNWGFGKYMLHECR